MESALEKILEQISAYELLNNMIPGAVYAVLADKLTTFSILSENAFADIVEFYFFGLIIGRVGSLIVERILKKFRKGKWIEQVSYTEYVKAEKGDDTGRVRMLATVNNMYRTFVAVFICLLLTVLLDLLWPFVSSIEWLKSLVICMGCIVLIIVFSCSYKKQTGYVLKRVNTVMEQIKKKEENDRKK